MPPLPLSTWAMIRHAYEHTERPVEEICAEHGISSGTLRDRMRRWNWIRRRPPIPDEGPPPLWPASELSSEPAMSRLGVTSEVAWSDAARSEPAAPACEGAAEAEASRETGDSRTAVNLAQASDACSATDESPADVAQRLQGAVGRVLPAIEATVGRLASGATHPRELERAARTLTALTRTLRELNALLDQHQAATEDEGPNSLDEFRTELARRINALIAERKGAADGDWNGAADD